MAITKNIDNITGLEFNNSQKNFQYGSGNNNDFYYFTGISLSYIFYKQTLNWQTICGLFLIVIGVTIVNIYKN